MQRSTYCALPLIALLLAGCQSIEGARNGGLINSTPAEEPFVATDRPEQLGREHFLRGNYALANRYFQAAVEAKPGDGDSWIGLAASYDQLGRFDLADRAYEQATLLKGQSTQILNNRGYSYALRGDVVRAEQMFQRARAQSPQNQLVNNNITLLKQLPK